MALAGRDHVDLARQAEFHRPAGLVRGQRRRARHPRGVALLAAEAAAQAAHHGRHAIEVTAQQAGADVLDLGGMLGRGMNDDVAVLAGQGEGHLAFEIEMLLAADAELGAQPVRRAVQRGIGIATQDGLSAPAHRPARASAVSMSRIGSSASISIATRSAAAARSIERRRHDHRQRLARELDAVRGEQRLVRAGLPRRRSCRECRRAPAPPRRPASRWRLKDRARAGGRSPPGSAPGRHAACRAARACRRYRAPDR